MTGCRSRPNSLMRIGYLLLPVAALVAALALLSFFPITPEKAREIRTQLEASRGKV
jgi:glycoside/pentoside/hexuronide:cation symporter, GPH family